MQQFLQRHIRAPPQHAAMAHQLGEGVPRQFAGTLAQRQIDRAGRARIVKRAVRGRQRDLQLGRQRAQTVAPGCRQDGRSKVHCVYVCVHLQRTMLTQETEIKPNIMSKYRGGSHEFRQLRKHSGQRRGFGHHIIRDPC